MKRKKLSVVLVFLLIAIIVGCIIKKEAELSKKEEKALAVVFPEIPETQAQEVEQIFKIKLPEKGSVLYYDVLLKPDELGYFYAEIEFSEEYYDELMEQVEKEYFVDELGVTYNEEYMFETTEEEIAEIYIDAEGPRRAIEMQKVPMTIYYWIYTTKVQDGTFKLLFVSGRC